MSLIAVDACGNAMLVFEKFNYGSTSLVSKRYYADTGWEDSEAVIEWEFNVGAIPPRTKALLSLAMHGGGNATLITGERVGPPYGGIEPNVRLQSRQYQPGRGWSDAVPLPDGDDILGGDICRRPIIDGFGNAISITHDMDWLFCGSTLPIEFATASGLVRYK